MKGIFVVLVSGLLLKSCTAGVLPITNTLERSYATTGNCLLRNLLCTVFRILPGGLRLQYCYAPVPKPTSTILEPAVECTVGQELEIQTIAEPEVEIQTTAEPLIEYSLEPACPLIDCEELGCPYGKEPTTLSNGCPECYECLPKPACKQPLCVKLKCPNGTMPTVLTNGCPGCEVCKPCDR